MLDREIHQVMGILCEETRKFAAPVVTQISETRRDPFQVLVATILSLRTKDEVTHPASHRLLARAGTPSELLALPESNIRKLIYPVGFYKSKARVLRDIARDLLERFDGRVPDNVEDLLSFRGVGRKTANLVVTLGYGKPGICVDTHVHRISNRLGYVSTRTPEETEFALREKLPLQYWIPYNDVLVTYGQNVCKPLSPYCSRCAVAPYCLKAGVARHR